MSESNNNNQDHQNAIDLVNDLIEGINPITKSRFEMETIFSSPVIARALFYIRNVLNNEPAKEIMVKEDDVSNKRRQIKLNLRIEKVDFDEVDFNEFEYIENIGINKFAKILNLYFQSKEFEFAVKGNTIINWLENEGFLIIQSQDNTKHIPSSMGEILGIKYKDVIVRGNRVKMNLYNKVAQKYIIEHLKDIYL